MGKKVTAREVTKKRREREGQRTTPEEERNWAREKKGGRGKRKGDVKER